MGIDKKILEEFLRRKGRSHFDLKSLPQISSMDILISYRENTSSESEPRKLIEARMVEVLKKQLPQISSMDILISYRENTSSGSEPRKLIEARMAEVLEMVSSKNTPSWFKEMLEGEKPIPSILKEPFVSKVKNLLE